MCSDRSQCLSTGRGQIGTPNFFKLLAFYATVTTIFSGMDWAISETNGEYTLVTADDLIRFWRLKVKGQGHTRPSRCRRHPSRRWGVEVLFYFIFILTRRHFWTSHKSRHIKIGSILKARSTPATMSKQRSTLLPKTATMSNEFFVEISSFRQSRTLLRHCC